MKKVISFLAIFIFAFNLISYAGTDIIAAKDFASAIKTNKSLIIIDANTAENYSKIHVTGSVNVPVKELCIDGPVEGLLKSPADLANYFGKKGISNTSEIIIYDDGSQKYSSRVFWTLKYLGAANVKLLHKDMTEWQKARIPLTKSASSIKAVSFSPSVNSAIYADMGLVKAAKGNAKMILVDARDKDEFAGKTENSKGHIPGAINLDYKDLLTESGAFKPAAEMESVLKSKGIGPDKEIIVYCQTSVRAAVIYAALKSVLNYPDVKVYDGAYNEWVADKANSVVI